MGELYASEANSIRSRYQNTYRKIRCGVAKNFQDMDFENARERDEMEEIVRQIQRICDDCSDALSSLEFK